MPLNVIRQDITKVKADAIVNTANPDPVIGGGTDRAVYNAAGENELRAARIAIGKIAPGEAVKTPAFALNAKYIIHTVGPVWEDGSHGEAAILKACYDNSLELAKELGCRSVAFPLIATGTYGFPKDKAIEIASKSIDSFLSHNDMDVTLVIFDKEAFKITGAKFQDITAYIDSNYVESAHTYEYGTEGNINERIRRERLHMARVRGADSDDIPDDIDELLGKELMTFSERVLDIMSKRGLNGPDVYNRQHLITKKVFSDMKNNTYYHPNKYTAIAFCLALELPLDETMDLLNSAGWTLSKSKKADLIVKWHIARGDYSIRNINNTLLTFGLKELDQYKQ
ncbi:MAG: macro domain-containing protein [Clostridiales bacterium]|nr:macro domain-containing protein [Clostridiales bacterium]